MKMQLLNKYLLGLALALFIQSAWAQKTAYVNTIDQQNTWVDSVFSKLNRKKKIAQLFFVRAHTNLGKAYSDSVAKVIQKEQLGGVVFFQGGPVRQALLSNQYQQLSHVPLLIAMDGEWGLNMRLDSTISYPYQMALGAVQNNSLIYQMGQQVAHDFKRMRMQMNLAPVMDINNNPDNPVINYRSFGDDKYKVAQKAIAYMQGMQQAGLLTSAKHFPGHGDTNVDSHQDLPQLNFTAQRLDTLEEYPFKQAIQAGISGIMIAHMNIPALDTAKRLPSTLSRPIVTGLLKEKLGFKGLIISDAMDMKGVVKYYPNGQADLRAFMAGQDVLELSQNSCRAIKEIKKAVRKGLISEAELDSRVKKVLAAKYWAGLNHYQPVNIQGLVNDLNQPAAQSLRQQLGDAAITLLKGDTLVQNLDFGQRTALVSIGDVAPTVYQRELGKTYRKSTLFNLGKNASTAEIARLLNELKSYNQIIIGVHDIRTRPQSKLDFNDAVKQFIVQLAAYPHAAVSFFANPYTIGTLPGIEKSGALLACYQKEDMMQLAAAKVLTRQLNPTGRLSVTINAFFKNGDGQSIQPLAL